MSTSPTAATSTADREVSRRLAAYLDASPTPFHACAEAGARFRAAGFEERSLDAAWSDTSGAFYCIRGGSLIAWHVPPQSPPHAPFRILGAHTDSPNLRIKPRPDSGRAGCRQLGVEIYGGVLLNSWLDRDLGLAGRVFLRDAPSPLAFRIDRPVLRVPQLAIHLNRDIRENGLLLNPQTHMAPIFGTGKPTEGHFVELLAEVLDVPAGAIRSWDAMCFDTQPAGLVGWHEEFLAGPRLDNLHSSYTAIEALTASASANPADGKVRVVSLFDHEEVGSSSERGAASPLLGNLLERSVMARGGTREDYLRAVAASVCVSADMAHATHPNYVERHEPDHHLHMNRGPVIKINANLRYASEAETENVFQDACERAGVPYQKWVNRTDLACGSTIGPITAANLGMRTVDVGCPQLAMHSIREMCGADDADYMVRAMTAFLDA